ncbi:hypothetical protein ACR30L_14695 [Psychromonas sp. PT13]|uniref:hypothetical protein n=1 Tax=Psychromonas sp. PT13 TaxID=3439547 RepID=UPI003EBD15A1
MIQNWKYLIQQANDAYQDNAYSEAISLNQQALEYAKEIFHDEFYRDPSSAVAASTISFLNLAESYTAVGDLLSANNQYKNAIHFLQMAVVHLALNDTHSDLIMRTAGKIQFEWSLFSKHHDVDIPIQSAELMRSVSLAITYAKNTVHH